MPQRTAAAPAPDMRPVPLRWFLFGVAFVGVIPALVATAIEATADISHLRAEEERRLRAVATRVAANLDREIAGLKTLLISIAAAPELAADQDGGEARVASIARMLGLRVVLHAAEGGRADPAGGVTDAIDRPGFGDVGAVVFAPVQRDGTAVQVIDGLLPPARIRDAVEGRFPQHQIAVEVLNSRGTVVAHVAPSARAGLRPVGQLHQAGAFRSGLVETEAVDGTRLVAVMAAPRWAPNWQVVASEPYGMRYGSWVWPLVARIAIFVLGVLIAAVAAWRLGGQLTRSLALLDPRAQTVASGADAAVRSRASRVLEFEALRASQLHAETVQRLRSGADRAALQEARTSSELLSSVVNATADLIHVTGLDGRVVLANRAALAVYGAGKGGGRVLGKRATDLLGPDLGGWLEAADPDLLRAGATVTREGTWRLPGGEPRVYAVGKSPWRNAAGEITGIVAIARDVTDQRAAEARLRGAQAELLRATHLSAMGAMASGLAHELSQPLAAATNFLSAAGRLLQQHPPASETGAAAVQDASLQVQRAAEIVRRLRDFVSRGEAELEDVELGELLSGTEELARAGGILGEAVLIVCRPAAALHVLADRVQMQQVLLNLIRNAAEAFVGQPRPPGAPGRIILAASPVCPDEPGRATSGQAEITVSDDGPGLPAEVCDRLFAPFVSTKRDGMGIGLAICHSIIEGHGGLLRVETGPRGTTFRIVLPPTACQEERYDRPVT